MTTTVSAPAPASLALTCRQREALTALVGYLREHGRAPTIRDVAGLLNARHHNAVLDVLRALARKGYLTLGQGTARGIRLAGLRLVADFTDDDAGRSLRQAIGEAGAASTTGPRVRREGRAGIAVELPAGRPLSAREARALAFGLLTLVDLMENEHR